MSSLKKEEKKALVKLLLKDNETNDVIELGFAAKLKQTKDDREPVVVTSSGVLPQTTDANKEVALQEFLPKSKFSVFAKSRNKNPIKKVTQIKHHETMDVSLAMYDGGDMDSSFLHYGAFSKKQEKEATRLSAFLFDDKEIIELQFENQESSYKLSKVSKEGFDVKRAKGAPVIYQFEQGKNRVVGVVGSNDNLDGDQILYPILFEEDMFVADASDEKRGSKTEEVKKTALNETNYHMLDSKNLKESIKLSTEVLEKTLALPEIDAARTDDIFTNLTVHYGKMHSRKEQEPACRNRSELLQEYNIRNDDNVITKCADIFIDSRGENPKNIFLTGKPGIGKSLFSLKLIRDWAYDRLFESKDGKIPKIQFAYLLLFRQLSLLGDEKLNLHELLNCSPVVDDNFKIDDSLFEYLIQNSSKVLIILDGYDEYSREHRIKVSGNFEEACPNDPAVKMPIPALCSKLIKRKILRNSVVLITSRTEKADELAKFVFDRHLEIAGFSFQQVTEYVRKYFGQERQVKEDNKNNVLEYIERNEYLATICHVPLLCYLLCLSLEWRITRSGNTKNLPDKITEVYDDIVIKGFLATDHNHSRLKCTEDHNGENGEKEKAQETLNKLEQLAAVLLNKVKFVFNEEDMKTEANLTSKEIARVKASGILHCIPGIRISAFETRTEYSFIHLTLQEFLAASFFVKNKKIPKREVATGDEEDTLHVDDDPRCMIIMFMAGILSKKKDKAFIEEILQFSETLDDSDRLLTLRCLNEYGDSEQSKLTIRNLYHNYCKGGRLAFTRITNIDCIAISYLLDIINLLQMDKEQLSPIANTLYISYSILTSTGLKITCQSLAHKSSTMTRLELHVCNLDGSQCVEMMNYLLNTNITELALPGNKITDEGIRDIHKILSHDQCNLEVLDLRDNKIADEGVETLCKLVIGGHCRLVQLDLRFNNKISDRCKERQRNLAEADSFQFYI